MNRSLRILNRAKSDIDRIFAWLEARSPQGAARWSDALFDTVRRVSENPEGYSVASEALPRWRRGVHQALFKTRRGKPYRIVFELTDTEILVLRVRGPGQPPLRRRDLPAE